tara:strand:- start:3408 stop:4139 length:732 start_codon:yes stop_codon:yes gene_type:complete
MPLSKRQKRRLLEVSKMIESSIVVKDDMEEIQLEYAQEIDEIIDQLSKPVEKQKELPSPDSGDSDVVQRKTLNNINKAREFRKRNKQIREARNYQPPPPPQVEDAPDWAKKLWKSIAKKCHPDRLSFLELSAIQIARRQIWFLEAKSLYEQRSWPKLIHIGVQVDEYVEEVSHKEQLGWLNAEYNGISNNIQGMQNSLAWKWGTNWENIDLRINIVIAVLNHKGMQVPSRQEITELLLKLEVD